MKGKKGKQLIELIQITHIACIINECSNLHALCLLSQLTFPKAKLLLMSSHQEDLNDWYQSLTSAIRYIHATHKHMLHCSVCFITLPPSETVVGVQQILIILSEMHTLH